MMKNDTTFVRMRTGDHLGDSKCRKKAGFAEQKKRRFTIVRLDFLFFFFFFVPG